MKKRLSALILCLLLVFVQSVSVLAEGTDLYASSEAERLENASTEISETFINPLYEDVVDESDLKQADISDDGIAPLSEVEYFTSIDEAGREMREYLKMRTETIKIGLQADAYDSSFAKSIAAVAMSHTGNPAEGDYLRWQYAGWQMKGSYYTRNNICYITLTYTVTYYTTPEQEKEVDQAVQELLSRLSLNGQSDYTKIKSIYDYICENVTYDYDNLNNEDYKIKYTAYGALINGTSVCQGYAVLFYRLVLEEGVDARLISGKGNGGAHAWNIVKIRDRYYNVDSTWDAGRSAYSYFLKCDGNFGNHVRSEEYTGDDFYNQYPMGTEDYTVRDGDLPVESVLCITADPRDYTGKVGDTAVFTVEATGKELNYQWQYCCPGSVNWRNSGQDGNRTNTLNILITESRNGQKYRCIVADGDGEQVISGEAAIYVEKTETVPEITKQPSDYSGPVGDTAVFTVEVNGDDLNYQWQYCNVNSSNWRDSGQSGNTTATLRVPVINTRDGQKYRCVITDQSGSRLISDTAVIYVKETETSITIISQPEDYSGAVGDTAVFTADADGKGLSYQWEYQNAGSSVWKASGQSGNKTDTLKVPVTAARDGQKYRCTITDVDGESIITDVVKIIVE